MALVAIVGRPNVGKSTLFNRLTKSRRAIVSEEAGTTRDRQYGKCDWNGKEFSVVDTGGWVVNSDDIFEDAIRKQVIVATEEADLVLFLVDTQNGLTDWDEDEEEDSPNDAPRGDDEWDWDDDDMNSIYMYDFSPAAMKALTLAGIETVDALKAMSDAQLAAIPGMTEKDLARIRTVLSYDEDDDE